MVNPSKGHLWGLLINSVLAGLVLGIATTTGFNADPNSIVLNITTQIFRAVNVPQATSLWGNITYIITILGVISTVLEVYLLLTGGLLGLLMAGLGTAAGYLFITSGHPTFSLALLALGAVVALFSREY